MIEADGFRMVEIVSRGDLGAHPVWADYHGDDDSELILSWGVAAERLEAELERYDYCGRAALFPVFVNDRLPARPGLVIAVEFVGKAAAKMHGGYLIGDHAIGVFVGDDDEFCLNRHLVGHSARQLEQIAAAAELAVPALLALGYRSRDSRLRLPDGEAIEGELRDFVPA